MSPGRTLAKTRFGKSPQPPGKRAVARAIAILQFNEDRHRAQEATHPVRERRDLDVGRLARSTEFEPDEGEDWQEEG